MDLVFLKTDILFFLLLAGSVVYAIFVFRDDSLRESWKKVICRPLAASAGVVFLFYIFVAAVDSIHFETDDLDLRIPVKY